MGDMLHMSLKEAERMEVMKLLTEGIIKNKEAAERLKLSTRQIKRLKKRYKEEGQKGVVSKKRGKASNRSYSAEIREKIRRIVEERYPDFGPKFAAEKLREIHGISVDKETLRKLMISFGLWKAKLKKERKIHQQRERRASFGELIQIDGSYHDWFEGRGEKCCLLVFVDDATSKIVEMRFVKTESTLTYFESVKSYIKRYGIPLAFYSDKHSIFRVNHGNVAGETQFKRAMKELGIETICALSPEAKGRVERANRTLQDRLIKEMRLRGISDTKNANEYAEEFMDGYNKKFGKKAINEFDSHRKVLPKEKVLNAILSERYHRKISKNLEFYFENKLYQVNVQEKYLGSSIITVCRFTTGELKIWYKNDFISCQEFKQRGKSMLIVSSKELNETVNCLCGKTDNRALAWDETAYLRTINRELS